MSKTYWTLWGILSGITFILLPPIGIPIALITLVAVPAINRGQHPAKKPLEQQIDFFAKQLGIEYGTPEEKLEQIATLAARAGAETRE